jgi:hypothetical protein
MKMSYDVLNVARDICRTNDREGNSAEDGDMINIHGSASSMWWRVIHVTRG